MNQRQFLEGMSHAACTVSVITTDGPHGRAGVTVSAMTSVSADPPTLLVCVHQLSPACRKLMDNGVLCVNVLSEGQSVISDTFAGRIEPPGQDKFSCARWITRSTGAPNLEDALIAFDCRISNHFQIGTHFIFIAEPQEIHIRQQGNALVYANRAYGATRKLDEFVAERHGGGNADVLHIACFATIGPFFIPRLVRTFLEKAPDTMFQFFEGSEREIEEANRSSPFDLILMYDSPALPECSKEILATVRPHVLLPAGHPLCESHDISLTELAEHPMILLDISPSRDFFTSLFAEHGLEPQIRFRSPSFETVRGMVANGLGYTILVSRPASAMSYDGGALATRPLRDSVTPGRLILRQGERETPSPVAKRFARHTREFFAHWGI